MPRYFIVNKPYGTICQFSPEAGHQTLADLGFRFPKDVYPVGRLDTDSEGLLLLTNDKTINHRLLHPKFKHRRIYLAQVDGAMTEEAARLLEKGVTISIDGEPFRTQPCKVEILKASDPVCQLPDRNPPIRYRKSIPTSFITVSLHEGKNRQVRKMTAAVGFPTLRLVRIGMEGLQLDGLQPGQVRELTQEIIRSKLFGE